MKLFQQSTAILRFDHAAEFAEAYQIGEKDFVLASKSIYETHFSGLGLNAHVEYKSKYGAGEPTDRMIDGALADFRAGDYERVIAIGGGAVIDMAKILILEGDYTAQQYFTKEAPAKKACALIAVPTTCGAGSEVSSVSIAELTALHSKLGLAADALYPDEAVLIPELLTGLPYPFFVTSAIDAFIHAVESYVSPRASLYSEMFSMRAMEMIARGFRHMIKQGKESRMELLGDFLTASNLAGVAFGNAGTGAVHAMSYPLSGVYHVTHGEANYQFLTAVFRTYQKLAPDGKIRKLNRFLAGLLDCEEENVYDALERLLDQMIARRPLHTYGMRESEIQSFAESVQASQQRLLNQSYVKLTTEQMAEIYRELY